jgi:hypothetical protein
MATPGKLNWSWGQGTILRRRITVTNPRTGAPANLLLWDFLICTAKDNYDDPDDEARFQLSYPTQISIVAGDNSTMEIEVPVSATSGADWEGKTTRLYIDVKGCYTGELYWLAEGRGTVRGIVTRFGS